MMLLFFSFLILYIILILLLVFFSQKKKYYTTDTSTNLTKVSLIIAVRNEEKNVPKIAKSILIQNYPKHLLEVIFVNDHSDDATETELKSLPSPISYINLPTHLLGKKKAITLGVEQATGELIITTDADCSFSENYITQIEKCYRNQQAKFISAPVVLTHAKNGFWKRLLYHFQEVEFGSLITAGKSLIHIRKPLLSNGANMAFSKKAFQEVSGYQGNEHIPSGDDEFLLQKIAAKYRKDIYFLDHPEAVVYTPCVDSLKSLFQQRTRWASKHKTYHWTFIMVLICVFIGNIGLYLCWLLPNSVESFVYYFIFKLLADASLVRIYLRWKRSYVTLCWLPIIELIYPVYLIAVGISSNLMEYEWKGRRQRV